jgi:hypothetical protein
MVFAYSNMSRYQTRTGFCIRLSDVIDTVSLPTGVRHMIDALSIPTRIAEHEPNRWIPILGGDYPSAMWVGTMGSVSVPTHMRPAMAAVTAAVPTEVHSSEPENGSKS